MTKQRLDQAMVARKLVPTRSQAESYIRLEKVRVDNELVTKPGFFVRPEASITLAATEQYVSRAALKLASVAEVLRLDFKGKTVLDVGSSTGGFTQYALTRGAAKVFAVDVGTDQLHPSLRSDPRIELHEQTDIRDVGVRVAGSAKIADNNVRRQPKAIIYPPDLVLADVSFISLRDILPHVATLCTPRTQLAIMVKPQFEAGQSNLKHKGVVKNDRMRRDILRDFEQWAQLRFVVLDKADSSVAGATGNRERFYLLKLLAGTRSIRG